MGDSLRQRLDVLERTQNEDGGWGYFPGKATWMEPTVYAVLALDGQRSLGPLERAWELIASWQLPDGSWRPCMAVEGPGTWVTALGVHLCCWRGEFGQPFRRAVKWLLNTEGREGSWVLRAIAKLQPGGADNDLSQTGWPWLRGASSWIEPTTQTILALRKAAARYSGVEARVRDAEGFILSRRCADGGWNYGSRRALGIDLPSYPETTALALLGLQARQAELGFSAAEYLQWVLENKARTRMGRAWLSIALRNLGGRAPVPKGDADDDVFLAALEALAHPDGNHAVFRVTAESVVCE